LFLCFFHDSFLRTEEPATEWITADKKKLKKPTSPPLPERGGGRGRGRSAPPGRGEGGRGGRGSGGRSSSVNNSGRGRAGVPKPESPAPSAEIEKKVESTETVEEKSETVVVETPAPPAVQTTKSNSAAPVWGGGMSLAQKLREQEIAANSPPPPPAAPAPPAEAATVEETPVPQEGPVSTAFAGQSKRVSSLLSMIFLSYSNFSHLVELMLVVVAEGDAHIGITHMLVQNLKTVMLLQNQRCRKQLLKNLRRKSKMCP
jgi:hypothetical protein